MKAWAEKIRNMNVDPFIDYYGLEDSPVNSRTAVRIDPYHGFSFNTRYFSS